MTKKSMDSESQVQQSSVKSKWVGDPVNNSDIGYPDYDYEIKESTGPYNPNEEVNENITED